MKTVKRSTLVLAVAATAVITSLATMVAAVTIVTTGTGTNITRVKAVSVDGSNETSSTTFVDVPSATLKINVSTGSALLLARFTGTSVCTTDGSAQGCKVRIILDDGVTETEMAPGEVLFDDSVNPRHRASGIQTIATVGPGTYDVKVQWRVENALMSFSLFDYVLTLERIV